MDNEFKITFAGKAQVNAMFRGMEIRTDQKPEAGGEGSAPEPFTLFLASIGTCAGIYVRKFCEARGIPVEGIHLTQRLLGEPDNAARIGTVALEVHLPPEFPEQYRDAVVRAAEGCTVKKYIQNPFQISTRAVLD